jgi:exosortase A-associated hydrolase 1
MSLGSVQEQPIVFDCQGSRLMGMVHAPENPLSIGVITLIAGGPQFRGGVGRGMVSMARALSAQGVPVLRFDYRGMGDSEGEFAGFEHIADDLEAAVEAFFAAVPALEKVVIWGGCDAASGAMIHGWKIPRIHSLVLANPWVYTPQIEAAVRKQHYLDRLRDPAFWRKLVRMEYNLLDYARAAVARVMGKVRSLFGRSGGAAGDGGGGTFVDRMLAGLRKFDGPVLFLLSGQSIVSKEFDELIAQEAGWKEVYSRPGCHRVDLAEADQTFSTAADRQAANEVILNWVQSLDKP